MGRPGAGRLAFFLPLNDRPLIYALHLFVSKSWSPLPRPAIGAWFDGHSQRCSFQANIDR